MNPPTRKQLLDLPAPPPCLCQLKGCYCPHHGTYEPAVIDSEVLAVIYPERRLISARTSKVLAQ